MCPLALLLVLSGPGDTASRPVINLSYQARRVHGPRALKGLTLEAMLNKSYPVCVTRCSRCRGHIGVPAPMRFQSSEGLKSFQEASDAWKPVRGMGWATACGYGDGGRHYLAVREGHSEKVMLS